MPAPLLAMFSSRGPSLVPTVVALTLPIAAAAGQCTMQWVPRTGPTGFPSFVRATALHDPDGSGPLPPVLVVAGRFTLTVAGVDCNHVATWEPVAGVWSTLGAGTNDAVHAVATLPTGDLVVAGEFTAAGGVPCNRVARWDGTAWHSLGNGTDATVRAVTVLANGDLVAGGDFAVAGTVAVANHIARWDGAAWSSLGAGMDATVRALATLPSGELVAGGAFTTAGGVPARRIARWNGSAWSSMGGGMSQFTSGVFALLALANGDLVAGGEFTTAGSVAALNVARWSGGSWSPLGGGVGGTVRALGSLATGELVANGMRWNGTGWATIGAASLPLFWPDVYSLTTLPGGDLVAGGERYTISGPTGMHLARWDGTTWSPLDGDFDGPVQAAVSLVNGDVVVSGQFSTAPGAFTDNIARWDGTRWWAMDAGLGGNARVLTTLPNGDLVASGQFGVGGGAHAFARWTGSVWSSFPGTSLNLLGNAYTMVVLPNGDWLVGGSFTSIGGVAASNVALWDGTTWSALGTGTNGPLVTAVVSSNGDVVVAGQFTTAGGAVANGIARWDGAGWSALDGGMTASTGWASVHAVLALPGGQLVAGGDFATAGGVVVRHVARWAGRWQPLDAGTDGAVFTLSTLPNGDVVAGGAFTRAGGVAASGLARWNGAVWRPLVADSRRANGVLQRLADGDLFVSNVTTAVGATQTWLARLAPTCPALAEPAGAGCVGSGGANALTAQTLPWLGAVCTTRATGMPANGLAAVVLGLGGAATPLAAILPQGMAGCTLLAAPDLVSLRVPSGGGVTVSVAIPSTPALATQTFRQQVVALELGATAAIVAATSTNALVLTIGSP